MQKSLRIPVRELLILLSVAAIWFPSVQLPLGPVRLNFTELCLAALAPIVLVARTHRLQVSKGTLLSLLAFLWLATLSIIQLMYVEDVRASLRMALWFVLCFVFILTVVGAPDRPRLIARSVYTFIIAGSISMLISNLDYFASILGGRTILEIGNRSAGFFQHPNQYAIWIGSFLPVVLLVVKRLSVLVLLASNALVALLLTGSKFNIFLAALLLCLCIAVRMRSGLRASVLSIFAVGVSLAFFSSILDFLFRAMEAVNPKYSAAFRAVIETPTESQTFLARMSLWREAMDYGLDNPVTGIGGGQAYLVLQRGIPHAHNLEMHYFMTYGLLGLSGLLVIFLVTFVYGLKGKTHQNYEYRLKYALLISIGAIFISNQSSDSLAGQQILLLGILVGFVLSAAEVRLDASRADKLPSTSEPMVEMDHPLTMRS